MKMIYLEEVFPSIDGEVNAYGQGKLTTFIRFSGCNFRCNYCFGSPPGRRKPKVRMSYGPKRNLTEVEKNDVILTYDEDFNIVETTVIETHSREVNKWLRITIDGTQYFVTHEHPFMTPRGIIAAHELVIGDDIYQTKPRDIISFKKSGDRNPMKDKEIAHKAHSKIDYKANGKKQSETIRLKQKNGTYIAPVMTEEAKKASSVRMIGCNNPNWKGGSKTPNYDSLKKGIKNKLIGHRICDCGSKNHLEVHHIDCDRKNDDSINLVILCKSCHTKTHKKGYNFWNGERRDGKQLSQAISNNGKTVEAIKEFNRDNYPPSIKPKPLKVYNLTCEPYNTYFLDDIWVHNCDTEHTQERNDNKVSIEELLEKVKKIGCKKLTITGGEPLMQKESLIAFIELLNLEKEQYEITIETDGAYLLFNRPWCFSVNWVLDYKLEYKRKMLEQNFHHLGYGDWLKIPIRDKKDYDNAVIIAKKVYNLRRGNSIAFSPINGEEGEISAKQVMKWLFEDKLYFIHLNCQLHKLISVE